MPEPQPESQAEAFNRKQLHSALKHTLQETKRQQHSPVRSNAQRKPAQAHPPETPFHRLSQMMRQMPVATQRESAERLDTIISAMQPAKAPLARLGDAMKTPTEEAYHQPVKPQPEPITPVIQLRWEAEQANDTINQPPPKPASKPGSPARDPLAMYRVESPLPNRSATYSDLMQQLDQWYQRAHGNVQDDAKARPETTENQPEHEQQSNTTVTLADYPPAEALALASHMGNPPKEAISNQPSSATDEALQAKTNRHKLNPPNKWDPNAANDDTLSLSRVEEAMRETTQEPTVSESAVHLDIERTNPEPVILGGRMSTELSGYKDLSKPPLLIDEEPSTSGLSSTDFSAFQQPSAPKPAMPMQNLNAAPMRDISLTPETYSEMNPDMDTDFTGNVQTLIRLVSDLPEGVTKQTGAQIIRLTMEAMGISMEDVLSEAQAAQSDMLEAVRANIKKIEEYKTVIRKLETDIKYFQGKANELSEIIDLFILSNTAGNKVPGVDEFKPST